MPVRTSPTPYDAAGRPGPSHAVMQIVRLALVAAPVIVAVLFWQLRRAADAEISPAANQMYIGAIFLWLLGLSALAAFRSQLRRAESDAVRATTLLMAWAVGEGVALFGAVDYFLTGGWSWYVAGLALLVADAFILFPIRRPA